MYANCEQVLLKGTLGVLSHKMSTNSVSSIQSLTLITDTWHIQLSMLPESYHGFRQGEGGCV